MVKRGFMKDPVGPRPLAYKHKDLLSIQTEASKHSVAKSVHAVERARKIRKPDALRFAKPHKSGQIVRRVHELEPAIADFYRYLLGPDRAPKTRTLKDYGVLSKEVTGGFTSFWDSLQGTGTDPSTIPTAKLVQGGFASLLAANYLMQENDCHSGNYGYNGMGQLSRIDFDQSLAPYTWGEDSKYYFSKADDEYDLLHLTNPKHFTPYNSPLLMGRLGKSPLNYLNTMFGKGLIHAERTDVNFKIDKWKTIMKAALLTEDMIKKILAAHMSDAVEIDRYAAHIYTRFQAIKKIMMNSEDFKQTFKVFGKKMVSEIEKEIDDYNMEFKIKYFERQIVASTEELEMIFGAHFSTQESEEILANLQKIADEIELKTTIVRNEEVITDHNSLLLIEECKKIIDVAKTQEELEKLNVVMKKTVYHINKHADNLKKSIIEKTFLVREDIRKRDDLYDLESKLRRDVEALRREVESAAVKVVMKKEEYEKIKDILVRAKGLSLVKAIEVFPVLKTFISTSMPDFPIKKSHKADLANCLDDRLAKFAAEQKQVSAQYTKLRYKAYSITEEIQDLSIRLDGNSALLAKMNSESEKIDKLFSSLQEHEKNVALKLEKIKASGLPASPNIDLMQRIKELAQRLEDYVRERMQVLEKYESRWSDPAISPVLHAVAEKIRLAKHLQEILTSDLQPKTERAFHRTIETFLPATRGGQLEHILREAKVGKAKPTPSTSSVTNKKPTE